MLSVRDRERPAKRRPATVIVLALAMVASFAAARGASAEEATIHIDNFTFAPAELTIAAGTKVIWLNRDDIPHVVAEKDGAFRSPALDTDDEYERVFTTPGTVEYFCSLHPHMVGRIVITP